MRLLDGAFLAMIAVLAIVVIHLAYQITLVQRRFERWDDARTGMFGSGPMTQAKYQADSGSYRDRAAADAVRGGNVMPNPATKRAGPPTPRKPDEPVSPAGGF